MDEATLKAIDDEYDLLAEEGATEEQIEKSKKEMSHLEEILGAPATIDSLCRDIVKHYEENRQYELTGKAMIVAYSRTIAMSIYGKLLELRPEWREKVKVVMTASNKDPEEWHAVKVLQPCAREIGMNGLSLGAACTLLCANGKITRSNAASAGENDDDGSKIPKGVQPCLCGQLDETG